MKKWIIVIIISIVSLVLLGGGLIIGLVVFVINSSESLDSTDESIFDVELPGFQQVEPDKGSEDPNIPEDNSTTESFFEVYDVKGRYAEGAYRSIYTQNRHLIEDNSVYQCFNDKGDSQTGSPSFAILREGTITDGNLFTWSAPESIIGSEPIFVIELSEIPSSRLVSTYQKGGGAYVALFVADFDNQNEVVGMNQYLPDNELSADEIKNCFRS
jgi:hypothetical protein